MKPISQMLNVKLKDTQWKNFFFFILKEQNVKFSSAHPMTIHKSMANFANILFGWIDKFVSLLERKNSVWKQTIRAF